MLYRKPGRLVLAWVKGVQGSFVGDWCVCSGADKQHGCG